MNKKTLIIALSIIAIMIIIIISGLTWYITGTYPVNKQNSEEKIIEITSGTRTEEIVNQLKEQKLIKNSFIAKVYMKLNGVKGLQAGRYQLNQTMSLKEIINKISSGDIYNETVKITFKEGKNMRWIAKEIEENTNNSQDDIFNLLKNEQYIKTLIQKHWFLEDIIMNENIYYPLEGYLYPDTYIFKNKDVSVETIFDTMLKKEEDILSKYRTQIENSGKSVHEILTIASIVELEGNDSEARNGISSVIYNRLKANMSLGSDVTTYYAIKVDMGERNLYSSELQTSNPYNTRGPNMNGKLPIGPVANPSEESINAALNPTNTNYLYFVADRNGKIYFTTTYQEHQNLIKELQKQGLWYEY